MSVGFTCFYSTVIWKDLPFSAFP